MPMVIRVFFIYKDKDLNKVTSDEAKEDITTNIIQILQSSHQLLACKFYSHCCNICCCLHDVMFELNLSEK